MKKTERKNESASAAEVKRHPLMEFFPGYFRSFDEWLGRWRETTILSEKLGLLHGIIENYLWEFSPELVCFLFDHADGYGSNLNFKDGPESYKTAKNRQTIAIKAFTVLCLKFFKSPADSSKPPLWWKAVKDDILFQKVFWFLEVKDKRNCCFRSDDIPARHRETFEAFLDAFARLGWRYKGLFYRYEDRSVPVEVERRIIAARPRFIEILDKIRALNWLNGREIELDKASIKKLTEIAMSENYFFPPSSVQDSDRTLRKPESLEEAALGGSMAAQIVVLNRICQEEVRRIENLFKRSLRRKREEDRQFELSKIERAKKELEDKAAELRASK